MLLASTAPLFAQTETGRILARKYDFKEAGKEMEYSLYVPTSYQPKSNKNTKKFPLIVALHGAGSTPAEIIRYPKFTDHAEKNGYIVVAPMGYNSRGWYGSRGTGGRPGFVFDRRSAAGVRRHIQGRSLDSRSDDPYGR